jgi:hypothetical protein
VIAFLYARPGLLILLGVALWSLCAFFTAGAGLADLQHKYPSATDEGFREDLGFVCLFGFFFGPVGLLIMFFTTGFFQYGFQWRKKERPL